MSCKLSPRRETIYMKYQTPENKPGFDISCKLSPMSPREKIYMKCQTLFSGKTTNISEYPLLSVN